MMTDHSETAIHTFVQAGGRSLRMGTDKAWLEVNGRPMIEHVLAAAQPVAASLSIVINSANPNAERYLELAAKWNACLLQDLHDHKGPLGGIHTALENCGDDEAALILACDLPFLTTELLTLLCQKHLSGTAQITVPIDQDNRLQPLSAIYDQDCLPAIKAMIAEDRLKVDQLFEQVRTQFVSFDEFARMPASNKLFSNLNSPQELKSAANHWAQSDI